jgi:hypothetical protein
MSAPSPAPPGWVRVVWGGFLWLTLTAFFAAAAVVVRGLAGGFDLAPVPLLVAVAGTLISGVVMLPLAALVDAPEAIWGHWLPARRAARGACPTCGYAAGHTGARACPECHASLQPPAAYAAGWPTLRRAAWLAAPAFALGCALGLAWCVSDERAFAVEVQRALTGGTAPARHERPRAGLASFARLQWTTEEGLAGPPPFVDAKEVGWKPRDSPAAKPTAGSR